MKRAFPVYAATLCTVLVAGNLFGLFSQSSQDSQQSTVVYGRIPQQERLTQTAEQLVRVLKVPSPAEWLVFSTAPDRDTSSAQLTVVDGLDSSQDPCIRFLFDSRTSELVSLSMSRPNGGQSKTQGNIFSAVECRAIAGSYMARIGEVVGGVWRWEADQRLLGGVYHGRWRSRSQSAIMAVDCQSGKLLYLRTRSDVDSDSRIASSKSRDLAKEQKTALSLSDTDRVEKALVNICLDQPLAEDQ